MRAIPVVCYVLFVIMAVVGAYEHLHGILLAAAVGFSSTIMGASTLHPGVKKLSYAGIIIALLYFGWIMLEKFM